MQAGVTSPLARSYAAWRQSALLIAAPIVVTGAVLALFDFRNIETGEPFNSFGIAAQVLPLLGPLVLAAASLAALATWTRPRLSSRVLISGWVASLVLPLLPALVPLDWLIDNELFVRNIGDRETAALLLQLVKAFLAIGYAVSLLPAIVTFPGGVVRGSLLAKGLVPQSSLPGFFLVATAPFYSLVVMVALVVVMQFIGTGLLVVGVLLLAVAPWVYVVNRKLYLAGDLAQMASPRLDLTQRLNGALIAGGIIVVLVWALTTDVDGIPVVGSGDDAFLDHVTLARVTVEAIGRVIVTTVAFAHVFLSMTVLSWRTAPSTTAQQMPPGEASYDERLSGLEPLVRN